MIRCQAKSKKDPILLSYVAIESLNLIPSGPKKPIPKKYSNFISKSITLKYRANRIKQKVEYNKLKKLVPQISQIPKNRLTKLTILEETIKHIAYLENQVVDKFQDLLSTSGECSKDGFDLKNDNEIRVTLHNILASRQTS